MVQINNFVDCLFYRKAVSKLAASFIFHYPGD